jgi:hypothetical protein
MRNDYYKMPHGKYVYVPRGFTAMKFFGRQIGMSAQARMTAAVPSDIDVPC